MRGLISGLRAWLMQRLSALYLALYTLFLSGYLLLSPPNHYLAWLGFVAHPLNAVLLGLFMLALLLHAWIGLRDIVIDYVHNTPMRLIALTLVASGLLLLGLWATKILLIAFVKYEAL